MTRSEAIEALAAAQLTRLSGEQRSEQLNTMLLENWSTDPGWQSVPADVRAEFEQECLRYPPSDCRYDPVLMLWLRERHLAASNAFLTSQLKQLGIDVAQLSGVTKVLEPCPCCGACTLGRRGDYEICLVCWWEDDGQDNASADALSGPNHVTLTQARANFLLSGIYDPSRTDLRRVQHPVEMYEQGRHFALSPDGARVCEDATGWVGLRVSSAP